MRSRPQLRLLTAIFAALLATALGACGSSGPENGLTRDQADKLVRALENLDEDVGVDDCPDGQLKLDTIRNDIAAIGAEGNVDAEIISGLEKLADQTEALLDDCVGEAETPTTPESTSTSSTTTPTETSTSSTEETDPAEETDTTPTDEEPPPEEEPVEPPSDNGPPGPEGNPSDPGGGFEPGGTGGLSPGQEKRKGASKPAKDKPAKPGKDKKRMMGDAASQPADQETESR